MSRIVYIAAGALLAFSATAQDAAFQVKSDVDISKMKAEAEASMVRIKTMGAIRGMTVKGAPYSAEEVTESSQTLADGTRIHRENKTTVYRDSEGRTRRESPDNITITDPVANVTYLLDPKTMTGQKLSMAVGNFSYIRSDGFGPMASSGPTAPMTFAMTSTGDGPATITLNGVALDEKAVAEAMAKAKASGSTQTLSYERHVTIATSGSEAGMGTAGGSSMPTAGVAGVPSVPAMRMAMRRNAGEPLGKQMIEGVNAEGVRDVSTIPAGAIGNDRPIQVSNESWYSAELQMNVLTKHSDPRTGDESFRLTNISRAEPAAYLFQPPTGYQITERK